MLCFHKAEYLPSQVVTEYVIWWMLNASPLPWTRIFSRTETCTVPSQLSYLFQAVRDTEAVPKVFGWGDGACRWLGRLGRWCLQIRKFEGGRLLFVRVWPAFWVPDTDGQIWFLSFCVYMMGSENKGTWMPGASPVGHGLPRRSHFFLWKEWIRSFSVVRQFWYCRDPGTESSLKKSLYWSTWNCVLMGTSSRNKEIGADSPHVSKLRTWGWNHQKSSRKSSRNGRFLPLSHLTRHAHRCSINLSLSSSLCPQPSSLGVLFMLPSFPFPFFPCISFPS